MADNAPNAIQFSPLPNLVIGFNRRVACHIINFTGANGSVTYNAARSSGGTGITRTGEGAYTLVFPPGGTGCVGWTVVSAVESTTSDKTIARASSIDTDVVATGYVAGSVGLITTDLADSPILNDVIGDCTVMVFILKA